MIFTLYVPENAAGVLRDAYGDDLGRAALEAIAIEGYRTGKLSRHEVQTLLGFGDRWETEHWLAGRGVSQNYGAEDLEADRETLRRTLGPVKP